MVLDFRATCFLLVLESFIAYRMRIPAHDFTWEVAKYVNYLQSNKVDAMAVASSYPTIVSGEKYAEWGMFQMKSVTR